MGQVRRTYIYYSDEKILDLRQQIPTTRWDKVKQNLSGVEVTVLGSGAKIPMLRSEDVTQENSGRHSSLRRANLAFCKNECLASP